MRDVFAGIGFMIAGVVTIITAQQFPTLPSLQYGPSLFPSLVGGGFCIGGAVLTLNALWQRRKAAAQEMQDDPTLATPPSEKKSWAMVLPPIAIVFYILASDYLGAMLTITIIMCLLMLFRKTKVYVALVTSVVMSSAIYFIFSHYLLIPLPQGVLLRGSLPWIS
ncbi:tripartite tricarboxylate transporter TctB family protein [Halomonas citrativorans]|uniref:Tripartite tricarboxylate transporter TctB family protein n=1 Tax=Halomonas citrativorans TaxID=2742612 RepID=A0ABR9FE87_9GAMM|nr:tripartite tricarboxylate transporter TctB family protein [Halomonas citrativorans]MBE0404374.1 tripartite tricarboxylate transporter TctB family protein [Halomonas citrativorans]